MTVVGQIWHLAVHEHVSNAKDDWHSGCWGAHMHHHVARTRHRRLAFTTWEEGRQLWNAVCHAAPGLVALCVMPDHIHLLTSGDVRRRLAAALSGFTRWRNPRRTEVGRLWEPIPEPSAVEGVLKLRRNIRYIHLNPYRAALVADPLAWPLSTHMDAVGLAIRPVRRRMPHPMSFHRSVSGDPSVSVVGTDLPVAIIDTPDLGTVEAAASMALRAPIVRIRSRGQDRGVFMAAARVLTDASLTEIGAYVGASRSAAWRARRPEATTLRVLERWIDDPRCTPLEDSHLRGMLARSRYRNAR